MREPFIQKTCTYSCAKKVTWNEWTQHARTMSSIGIPAGCLASCIQGNNNTKTEKFRYILLRHSNDKISRNEIGQYLSECNIILWHVLSLSACKTQDKIATWLEFLEASEHHSSMSQGRHEQTNIPRGASTPLPPYLHVTISCRLLLGKTFWRPRPVQCFAIRSVTSLLADFIEWSTAARPSPLPRTLARWASCILDDESTRNMVVLISRWWPLERARQSGAPNF